MLNVLFVIINLLRIDELYNLINSEQAMLKTNSGSEDGGVNAYKKKNQIC